MFAKYLIFSQYLNCVEDFSAVEPAIAVNGNDIDRASPEPAAPGGKTNFFAGTVAFFTRIVAFFTRAIRSLKQMFGIVK